MKKFLTLVLSLSMALSLAACGGQAPAEEPAPSSSEEAAPVCEHVWKEATYEAPRTCEKCGETEGEKLTPYLETLDLKYVAPDEPAPYNTVCDRDPQFRTTGRVLFTNMSTIEGDDYYTAKEGYEWRLVDANFYFFDEAFDSGYTYCADWVNYYGREYMDEAGEQPAVSVNGELFPVETRYDFLPGPYAEGEISHTVRVGVQVPKGFDGLVWCAIALDEPGVVPPYEEYMAAENTVFCKQAA